MPVAMRPVFSSYIAAIGYDPEKKEFYVSYIDGGTSRYRNIPQAVADDISGSASIGKAVHRDLIANHYPHSYSKDGL